MAVSPEDLIEILESVENFLTAKEAQEKSISSERPLAKVTLNSLVVKINEKVAKTERFLIDKVDVSNESPAISLVTAALEKKGYRVEVSGSKTYTQFIVYW